MDAEKPSLTREILRISHPWVLLASSCVTRWAAGSRYYLGGTLRGDIYLAGQIAVLDFAVERLLPARVLLPAAGHPRPPRRTGPGVHAAMGCY